MRCASAPMPPTCGPKLPSRARVRHARSDWGLRTTARFNRRRSTRGRKTMGFLFFLSVLVGWAYLYSRLRRAEDRLEQDQYERSRNTDLIAELTRRVWALEKSQTATPPEPVLVPPPVVFEPPPIVVPPTEPQPSPEPMPAPVFNLPELFREPTPPQSTWR